MCHGFLVIEFKKRDRNRRRRRRRRRRRKGCKEERLHELFFNYCIDFVR
jgi:hypothetical protein